MTGWIVKQKGRGGFYFGTLGLTKRDAIMNFFKAKLSPLSWQWYEREGYRCVRVRLVEVKRKAGAQ